MQIEMDPVVSLLVPLTSGGEKVTLLYIVYICFVFCFRSSVSFLSGVGGTMFRYEINISMISFTTTIRSSVSFLSWNNVPV